MKDANDQSVVGKRGHGSLGSRIHGSLGNLEIEQTYSLSGKSLGCAIEGEVPLHCIKRTYPKETFKFGGLL